MKRLVLISNPSDKSAKVIEINTENPSPYDLVRAVSKESLKITEGQRFSDYLIGDILPIHNLSGIRDKNQIRQMFEKISKGEHIVQTDGIPNIKLIVAPDRQLLLFDGTHSLLAYFQTGKTKLHEAPFLLIGAENFEPVTAEEIAYFFPEHTRDLVKDNWEKYVVNWQSPKENQLEVREVNSIKQLASQLSERNEGTEKQ